MSLKIKYIKHKEINKEKWDNCIDLSKNRIVYAMSWYLDRISPEWDALIEEDYESVMPLVQGRKYFIDYIYNPFFTAKLGVFSNKIIDISLVNEFFQSIPKKFKMVNIKLNIYKQFDLPDYNTKTNTTYELNLNRSYEELAENFSKSHKKNILKSIQSGVIVKKEDDVSKLISLKKERMLNLRNSHFKTLHFERLSKMLNYALNNEECIIYNAYENNIVCASAVFLIKYKRAVKYTATNDTGKKNRAGWLLTDTFLKEMSGTDMILDFAGSNIKGIAEFNAGFGSTKFNFPEICKNKLRFPFKLLKK